MFASLFRHQRLGLPPERTPLLQAFHRSRYRDDADADADANDYLGSREHGHDDDDEQHDEDDAQDEPLLPVFSEFLDRLPVYNATHSLRLLIVQRCETTLSWDQLRSPQVSQFLVKPVQVRVLSDHFSRATLYCLLANALQFQKEGQANPANMGVSRTRAMLCELMAMRLLKEFSTRELIDALSYDFDPLQGMAAPAPGTVTPAGLRPRSSPRAARISTLEVAIRAQAKKFLAHPVVVQQLEAIWAGTIVFHLAADRLHRQPKSRRASPTRPAGAYEVAADGRRSVTLYDPHDASLFKLSRLRVPRYRHFFSTVSFAIMLGLFLAALVDQSTDITALEVLFWFWSAGYMLDEIVGFSEQGFGLYIMSVWNAFDLGILLLFVAYYVLRLYGIVMPDAQQRRRVADMAYNVLGSSAVLLFPRLFSVLDHYRYFSQLLIAFRMMAMDLVSVLILIVISCSGFVVAFTMSFKHDLDARGATYALFQMLMGFTPAAWEIWDDFNVLGKVLLTLFLFICHFLIVTILITVLTNSFMAIVQNANEEHQFLFAVNTISMVKSDALFSYIAPSNIFGWLVIPLKYAMPFRKFIKTNRTIVKMTHVPILFSIFLYERLVLSRLAYGPTDLVEQRGRATTKVPAFSIRGPADMFSPGARLREPSITTFRKDRALEEVFRRPFRESTMNGNPVTTGRRLSSNVVRDWMNGVGQDGGPSPPQEEAQSVLERLETRRPKFRRNKTAHDFLQRRHQASITTRSVASDPNFVRRRTRPKPIVEEEAHADIAHLHNAEADADGDDELVTNDEDERETSVERGGEKPTSKDAKRSHHRYGSSDDDFFRTPTTAKPRTPAVTSDVSPHEGSAEASQPLAQPHVRHASTTTVLFSPPKPQRVSGSPSPSRNARKSRSGTTTPGRPVNAGRRTPNRPAVVVLPSRPRPIPQLRELRRPMPRPGLLGVQNRRDPSFSARALDLASDLGDNRHGPDFGHMGLPASFSTQLEAAALMAKARNRDDDDDDDENSRRVNKLVLARMSTLEEGFRDFVKEVKALKGDDTSRGGKTGKGKGASAGTSGVAKSKPKAKNRGKTEPSDEGDPSGHGGHGGATGEARLGSSL